MQDLYALIGYPLSHSFSPQYFAKKFRREGIQNAEYIAMPLENIDQLPDKLVQHPNLRGINVTIPYKQQVFKYLDEIDEGAKKIGAVNTIKIHDGKLKGYNTDAIGFELSLKELIVDSDVTNLKALVLGSGGAAQAVTYVLEKMNIPYKLISRSTDSGDMTYDQITPTVVSKYQLLINTTPLGMSPNMNTAPNLPYNALGAQHYLYDLVYNPSETLFMKNGKNQGATISNGLKMLYLQAEAAWEIWNS